MSSQAFIFFSCIKMAAPSVPWLLRYLPRCDTSRVCLHQIARRSLLVPSPAPGASGHLSSAPRIVDVLRLAASSRQIVAAICFLWNE